MKWQNRYDVQPTCSDVNLPEIVPPLQCDEVAEPLMSQLVGHNSCHPLLVNGARLLRGVQQVRLPVKKN